MTALPGWARALLRCPACHAELADAADGTTMACSGCSRVYPVSDGVPVLLVDETIGGE